MENRHLFITDLDGTLLTDDRTVSHRDLETLHRLRDKGNVVAAATGRSLYSFERALAHMEADTGTFPLDYLIFSTGAGVLRFTGNEIIRHLAISRSDVMRITACFDRQCLDYMVHDDIPDTHHFMFRSHGRDNPDFFSADYPVSAVCRSNDTGYPGVRIRHPGFGRHASGRVADPGGPAPQ